MATCKAWIKKDPSENFVMVLTWKTKKLKISKFVDPKVYNRYGRERGIDDLAWIDREGWRRKIKLQAQESVKTLRICIKINKNIIKRYFRN